MKLLHYLCLHFARPDGLDKNSGKKITQLKRPKYQKTKRQKFGMNQTLVQIFFDNSEVNIIKTKSRITLEYQHRLKLSTWANKCIFSRNFRLLLKSKMKNTQIYMRLCPNLLVWKVTRVTWRLLAVTVLGQSGRQQRPLAAWAWAI
jgi:hypothetical protein